MKRILLGVCVVAFAWPAVAADLKLPGADVYKAPLQPSLDQYTGFYLGGEFGYGFNLGNTGCASSFGPCDFGTLSAAPQGFVGGAFGGYGARIGGALSPVYLGIEGNWDVAALHGSAGIPGSFIPDSKGGTVFDAKSNWLASVRARAGFIYENVMAYGTIGWGWGGAGLNVTNVPGAVEPPTTLGSASTTLSGFVWGGGVEFPWFFGQGWKARLQYLQYDFGSINATCAAVVCPVTQAGAPAMLFTQKDRVDTITAGLSYKF